MTTQSRRRPALITAGAIGTAALALSTSGTLSGFTASITNSTNTAGMGSLTMQETGPDATGATQTCNSTDGNTVNAATCSTINKYGGDLKMNTTSDSLKTVNITIKDTGNISPTTFTLTPAACTATDGTSASDLCNTAIVSIYQDGSTTALFSGTPNAFFAKYGTTPLSLSTTNVATGAPGSSIKITFDTSAVPNADQGLTASQPLTWTFNA